MHDKRFARLPKTSSNSHPCNGFFTQKSCSCTSLTRVLSENLSMWRFRSVVRTPACVLSLPRIEKHATPEPTHLTPIGPRTRPCAITRRIET